MAQVLNALREMAEANYGDPGLTQLINQHANDLITYLVEGEGDLEFVERQLLSLRETFLERPLPENR